MNVVGGRGETAGTPKKNERRARLHRQGRALRGAVGQRAGPRAAVTAPRASWVNAVEGISRGTTTRSPSQVPCYPFLGEDSPAKIDVLKKVGTLILTSLLEDLD